MKNTLLNKKIELTDFELTEISNEIDSINARIDVLDPNNIFENNELEALDYRLTYLIQVLETSHYWARRRECGFRLIKGGKS